MKKTKFYLTLFLLIVAINSGYSQAQIPDILIYKGDTLELFTNPLEHYGGIDSVREKLWVGDCDNFYCNRKYIAEWTIIEDQLFLTHLYTCCFDNKLAEIRKTTIHLEKIFGDQSILQGVKADWLSTELECPQGNVVEYVNLNYQSLYERQIMFHIQNGVLKHIDTFDNSKSKQSDYSKNHYEKLYQSIYGNIHWDSLPHVGSLVNDWSVVVDLKFSANELGVIDSIILLKRTYETDPLYDQYRDEAVRVMKTIPNWDIYYRYGKHERRFVNIRIHFTKEHWKKYKNQN